MNETKEIMGNIPTSPALSETKEILLVHLREVLG